ncbi:MAG: Riboflavin synthase [Turneriella sp.]|nr:Riboflavin synthase [Turneriella sp.]
MFTGLIEEVGVITNISPTLEGIHFQIGCKEILSDIKLGDSISVSGACQTVESFDANSFTVFSIPETLSVTNFKLLQIGSRVNLERALRLGDRLGGHIVQGHAEGVARVISKEKAEALNIILEYESDYILSKGSVCLDGISLTVMEKINKSRFRIQIIPETERKTNISTWENGTLVNIEVDYIIKSLDQIRRAK